MAIKTLIVSYLPRLSRSRTKILLDTFLDEIKRYKPEIQTLDLIKNIPDLFLPDRLNAYFLRNYNKQKLSAEDERLMSKMDAMTDQIRWADVVALVYPMQNFSLPAIVKAFFDSILQKGKTWDISKEGYVAVMKGKKAIILTSSGGVYKNEMAAWEHSVSLAKIEFQFMKYDTIEVVFAEGLNMFPDKEKEILDGCKEQIKGLVKKMYESH
jgi:FMN-dependent NADH-azoreductase